MTSIDLRTYLSELIQEDPIEFILKELEVRGDYSEESRMNVVEDLVTRLPSAVSLNALRELFRELMEELNDY